MFGVTKHSRPNGFGKKKKGRNMSPQEGNIVWFIDQLSDDWCGCGVVQVVEQNR